jgi:hypothetical protein
MAHGFTIKEGQTDLKPYVYEAVEALFADAAPTAAQDVAVLVTALRTVVGMLHHKATTPLERESIKIAEAAIAAHQQREGE